MILFIICLNTSLECMSQVPYKTDTVIPLKTYLGISIGLTNNFHSDIIDGLNFISSSKTFTMGENFTKPLNKKWEFTFEAALQIGGLVKSNFYAKEKNYSYEMYKTGIDLPISFRYLFNNKAVAWAPDFIHFGPVFSYNLASNKQITFYEYGNNSIITRNSITNFENAYSTSIRIGTGYTFKLKYAFMRAELDYYYYGFNSLKNNTLPMGNLTGVTNDALGMNLIIENRNKFVNKKIRKPKANWLKY